MENLKRKCLGSKFTINLQKCLQFISVGKFATILFLNRKNGKSSTCGGLITLIWGIAIIAYTYITLASVFHEETFTLSSTSKTLSYYHVQN